MPSIHHLLNDFSKVVLFALLLIFCIADGRRRRSGTADVSSDPSSLLTQRLVLEKWVDSMNAERDYNGTEGWHRHLHSKSASDIFAIYNLKFSDIAKSKNAIVYFASLGACDGTADKTIRERYLKFPFWQGVFVEPVGMNFADLTAYLEREGALNRSTLIRAAATSKCAKPTIEIERPLYEEKDRTSNKSTPHWLRRQIASIVPSHRSHAREGWTKEAVRCITAGEVLTEWTAASSGGLKEGGDLSEGDTTEVTAVAVPAAGRSKEEATAAAVAAGKKKKRVRRRRPHVLKIDVEGHDYDVLMSFVMDDTPIQDLPLMIEFEAKSIAQKFPLAKARLESIGYIVSDFGSDGFALLRGDRIFIPNSEKNNHLSRGLTIKELLEKKDDLDKLRLSLESPLLSEARRARQQLSGGKKKGKKKGKGGAAGGGKKQRKPQV